jgi:triacylglycerol esterase/lipase EstA (alpha/beta hydrolase family)
MMATVVRLALAAELAAWWALGAWAAARFAWGAVPVAAACVAGAAAARLAIVASSFALAHRWRSPRGPGQRLGPPGTARLVAGEWRAMLRNNFWALPFERLALRPDPPLAPSARPPVIVVHGYLSNRGTVLGLARALDRADVGPVFVPSLPHVLAPIEAFAASLERVLAEVTTGTGQAKAILVCHSMGGLVARTLLACRGAAGIAGLVTVGSPHHGSALAALAAGHNARQMRPGSAFLRGLEAGEGEAGPGIPALSVYTVHDNLVAPQDSSRLAWAQEAVVPGVGHLAMLDDPRVHAAVAAYLGRLGRAPGAPAA